MALVGTVWKFFKKLNIEVHIKPVTPLLGLCPKERNTHVKTGVCAAYSQYPPAEVTQMCLGWRGDELSVVNPCGGTLFSLKKNEVLINATPRTALKNMMFSERSQTPSLTLYGSIYVKCPKQANAWRGRADDSYVS